MEEGGFEKQRRNLLLVSLLVFFFRYGEVSVEKASFAGVNLNLGNPVAIVNVLLAVFFYLALRYFQYLGQEGGWIKLKKCWFSSFETELWRLAQADVDKNLSDYEHKRVSSVCEDNKYAIIAEYFILSGGVNTKKELKKAVPWGWYFICGRRSFLDVFLYNPVFTDYIFPVLFAFSAFLYYFFA